MKRADQLIRLIRERTRNTNFSQDTTTGDVLEGISDNLILQYLNEAQDHLQSAILSAFPNSFVTSGTESLVGGTADYTIEDRIFLNNKIIAVEIRHTNSDSDWHPLDQKTYRDIKSYAGFPDFYIRRGATIKLCPYPQSSQGNIRITYYRELDDLDIRRAEITAITLIGSNTVLTTLTVDTDSADQAALDDADYFCICDRYGSVKTYNVAIDSYDSSTGVVSIVGSAHTITEGYVPAVGDYLTVGKYTTTLSTLPDNCERYLIMYAQERILCTDESNTSIEEGAKCKSIELDILNSYGDESRDIEEIPVLDEEIMI